MRLIPLLLATAVLSAQAPLVQEAPLRAHLSLLADDLLEGRGTGQRGGDLTVKYLETQLLAMGLKPPAPGGCLHSVRLLGLRTLKEGTRLAFRAGSTTQEAGLETDAVVLAGQPRTEIRVQAPVVFGGYGIQAPEENWDDFAGQDLKGKVLLVLVNEPRPTAEEPGRFDGPALTFHGRWVSKFQVARRLGAAAVLVVHSDEGASYPWGVVRNSWAGERFQTAPEGDGNPIQGWLSEGFTRRLLAAAGQDLDDLRARAERRGFRALPLNLSLDAVLRSTVRELEQFNVAAVVPGTDPALRSEAVVYSAHWDHFGREDGPPLRIYNGALDNASGCAAVLAMAQAAASRPAPRSQLFLFACAEEQGLLGSEAWVRAPLWPLAKTVAVLNLDVLNWVGRTKDISLAGAAKAGLLETGTKVAAAMGLQVAPVSPDTSGAAFRSDHFPFVRRGVPAFTVGSGLSWAADDGSAAARQQDYGRRYHQPTDRYDPAWDLSGMVQQAQYTLNLGWALASAPAKK